MADKTEEKTEPQQSTMFGQGDRKKGDPVIIGETTWHFDKYSDDGKKMHVTRTMNDRHTASQWIDVSVVDGNDPTPDNNSVGAQHDAPNEVAELTAKLNEMAAKTKKLEEELEHQRTLVMVAERQRDAAKEEAEKTKSQQPTHRLPEADEVLALKSEVDRLKVENSRLEKRLQHPPVEVKTLIRIINVKEGTDDDQRMTTWMEDGWQIVPELTHLIHMDGSYFERITFRRINQQPTQPYHPIHEVDRAFSHQADRSNPILKPNGAGGMPLTNLMRQGYSTDQIKDAMDTQALTKARTAGLVVSDPSAKRDLTHIALLTAPEVITCQQTP